MLQLVMMHNSSAGTGEQSRGGNAGLFRQSAAGVCGAAQEQAERPITGACRPAQVCQAASKRRLSEGQGSSQSSKTDSGTQEPPSNVEAMKILATLVTQGDTGEDGNRHRLLPPNGVSSGEEAIVQTMVQVAEEWRKKKQAILAPSLFSTHASAACMIQELERPSTHHQGCHHGGQCAEIPVHP